MTNLLKNPTLGNWQRERNHYFTDREGKQLVHEYPEHWDFVTIARESDPNKLPQTFHRDEGFVISAGYRAWEAGWKQRDIHLDAGRYRAKARLKADVNFPGGQAPDLTAITWRFTIESGDEALQQNWAMTSKQTTKQTEDFEFVFETTEALTMDLTFWARSFYAGNDCDFWVYEIGLEPVDSTYGATEVPTLGSRNQDTDHPPDDTPSRDHNVTEIIPHADVEEILNSVSGKSLGEVTTISEIDQIVAGLRALANTTTDATARVGINTLADALARLK